MSIADMPRAVRTFLVLSLPRDWRDDILRDLEEAWSARRAGRGRAYAALWLSGQALLFALRFLPERARDLADVRFTTSPDVRLAVHSLTKAPLTSVLSVVSLSVGIAAALTGFSVIEGTVFKDLPFPGGDRIMLVQDYDRANRFTVDVRADEYLRRRDGLTSFEYLSAFVIRSVVVGETPETSTVARAFLVTPGFLRMTETSPIMGRLPDADDVRPGAEPIVVLPFATAVRLMGTASDAVGRTVAIGGVRRTVVGVMPEGFGFPWNDDIWIPFDARDSDTPVSMVGKLRPGVGVRRARAEMAAVARPDPSQVAPGADIAHLVTKLTRPTTDDLQLLWTAVPIGILVLLLLVMATNVANLVLARNATRSAELAVRSALGASRARVVGQLALEVVLTAVVAGLAGVGISRLLITVLETWVTDLPTWMDFSLSNGAVAFAVVLGGLVTLVAGVAPALRVTAWAPAEALKSAGRVSGVRFGRMASALIVAQLTISVGFLSAATLLGQSLLTYTFDRYDIPADETLVAQIYWGWPQELNDPESGLTDVARGELRQRFLAEATRQRREIRAGVLALPRVTGAAYGSRFPGNDTDTELVEVEGLDVPPRRVEVAEVGPGYFELVGATAVAGRLFRTDELADGLPAVVVNEPFVRTHLRGVRPVGRRLRLAAPGDDGTPGPWVTVVGVVPDLGLNPGNPANAAAIYRPLSDRSFVYLAVLSSGEPGALAPRIVGIAGAVDPSIQVQRTRTLAAQMREPMLIFKGLGMAFLILGGLALLLSAASLHALTSFTVTRRTRELGIRQALGAGSRSIVRTVVHRAAAQVAAGLVLGLSMALGLLRIARSFPWEVRQSNPAALALVLGVLALSAAAALARPLLRALRIRPADAMRSE
jgi:putative ABC transport system permease protein